MCSPLSRHWHPCHRETVFGARGPMQTLGLWQSEAYGRPATELKWPLVFFCASRHQQCQPLLYLSLLCSPQQSASTATCLLWRHAAGQVGPRWLLESTGHAFWRSGCRQRSRPPWCTACVNTSFWLPMPVQMKPGVWSPLCPVSELSFPAQSRQHSLLCGVQGEVGGAGMFAWLRLGCMPGWSQENRQSSVCPHPLYWGANSTHMLLTSGLRVGLSTTLCLGSTSQLASWGLLFSMWTRIGTPKMWLKPLHHILPQGGSLAHVFSLCLWVSSLRGIDPNLTASLPFPSYPVPIMDLSYSLVCTKVSLPVSN